ncbi:MAG TPA: hypothetical protein VFE91_04405, partial [Nitrososphaerales archaeon]|nr:hypothetical protein [Nitrososphaerales archaeon]
LLVLAVPYSAINDSLAEMGDGVNGKILIDATNPLNAGGLAVGFTTSEAEEIQKRVPKAHVIKAFNTVFASHMDTGTAKGKQLAFYVAGDDKEAKARVLRLGKEIGFDPVDAGPLSSARMLESMAYLIIFMGYSLGMTTEIGFSLVH